MRQRLLDTKALELRQLALKCGSSLSGTKPILAHSIQSQVDKLLQTPDNSTLVSVDLGLKNIGLCQINLTSTTCRPTVYDWRLINLDNPPLAYPSFASAAIDFARCIAECNPAVVLIERQRSRSAGAAAVPHDILRINVLEGMVYTALQCMYPQASLFSIEPKAVLGYWKSQLGLGKTTTYRESKNVRLNLVKQWLACSESAPFDIDPRVTVQASGKKDDLYDALTQAITWNIWRANAASIKKDFSI